MKINKLLILTFLVGTLSCSAQVLTLDSCFTLAKQNNIDLKKAAIDVRVAQEVKRQLVPKFFPTVNITALGAYANEPLFSIDVTQMGQTEGFKSFLQMVYEELRSVNPSLSSEMSWLRRGAMLTARAVQPVFAGGRIVNGNKMANLGIDAANLKLEVSERDILQSVEETYWLVSGLIEKRSTIRQVQQLLDTLTEVTNTALEAGVITQNDILKVELKKNEIASLSMKLENGITLASHLLCQMIGIPMDTPIELETLPTLDPAELTLNQSINVSGRPEYELLELNVKAEKMRKRMTIGETLPSVGLGIMGGFTNFFECNRTNAIGFVVASVPLSAWWENSHKIKEHNLKIQEAELMRDDLQNKLKLQNEQVYNALTESATLMKQHASASKMAEDNYNISLMNYEAGLATMSELLESHALLMQAYDQYTDARITYRTNLHRFEALNK